MNTSDPGFVAERPDIGISLNDAKQLKQVLLLRAQHLGHVPDISSVARELIEAFKEIDNQAFLHSEAELAGSKSALLTNTKESVVSDPSTAR